MNVIIAGAGDIGIELAKRLTMDNHDVVVLEKDSEENHTNHKQLRCHGCSGTR